MGKPSTKSRTNSWVESSRLWRLSVRPKSQLHLRLGARSPERLLYKLSRDRPVSRASWWQDYTLSHPQVLERARPLPELRAKHPAQGVLLDAAVAQALHNNSQPGETTDAQALRWLPLVSRHATDWVVLLDPSTARVRGYVHLDGF